MPSDPLSRPCHSSPDASELATRLAPFGIRVGTAPVDLPADLKILCTRDSLDDGQQEQLLSGLDPLFADLALIDPLLRRDLLQLWPGKPASEEHLARFARYHRHDDDEGRYVVSGRCVFGFALPGLGQIRLGLTAGDFLCIPAGTEHWFSLDGPNPLKAVRLFSRLEPMHTTYSGRPILPLVDRHDDGAAWPNDGAESAGSCQVRRPR